MMCVCVRFPPRMGDAFCQDFYHYRYFKCPIFDSLTKNYVSIDALYLSLSFYLEAFLDFPVFRLQILACIRDEYFGFCPLELALKEDFEKKAWIE